MYDSTQSTPSPYRRILTVFGTRPEAIKMAPLVLNLNQQKGLIHKTCITGQHREMLHSVLSIFKIKPDFDLEIMTTNQSLETITSKVLVGMRDILKTYQPDLVLVHGDTATTFATALAAYYAHIQIGHIEAGLRTGNLYSPWPEEANRKLTTAIANLHFAPTDTACANLASEGVRPNAIVKTGNTVIDALHLTIKRLKADEIMCKKIAQKYEFLNPAKKLILVTGHRRENFGKGFENICQALLRIAKTHSDCEIIYPVHLNPKVIEPVHRLLKSTNNIFLTEPADYLHFVYLMNQSYLILTDSGGIQEEAPALGKPVLVLRDTTERPEAIAAGTAKLVGTEIDKIVSETTRLLNDKLYYREMSEAHNPYGDGKACERIVSTLLNA